MGVRVHRYNEELTEGKGLQSFLQTFLQFDIAALKYLDICPDTPRGI